MSRELPLIRTSRAFPSAIPQKYPAKRKLISDLTSGISRSFTGQITFLSMSKNFAASLKAFGASGVYLSTAITMPPRNRARNRGAIRLPTIGKVKRRALRPNDGYVHHGFADRLCVAIPLVLRSTS